MTKKIQTLPAPEGISRVETGALQFGDDWPGVFIRGDNACMLASSLASIVNMRLMQGDVAPQEFASFGFMVSHARMLAECDLTGVVVANVETAHQRLMTAAALYDTPAVGGVQ